MSVFQTTPRPLPVGTLTTHRVVTAIEHVLTRLASWRRARQAKGVVAVYRSWGYVPEETVRIGEWATLVLRLRR